MAMVYRDAPNPSDALEVSDLVAGTGFFRADEVVVARELVEERIRGGEASGYFFWFADDGGRLAGYVCYGPVPCTAGSFDLYWIAVDRDRQSRGLGKRLVRLAEDSARSMGARRMYVETAGKELYRPTRAFYERIGYSAAATLPDFYDAGDAKIIYQKNLV